MKKGFIRGVLTCDPSWRGLAFTIHIPSLKYNESLVMDVSVLLDNKKTLTQPLVYTGLIVTAIGVMIKRYPMVRLCDKLIIESQFQENMKSLSTVIVSVLLTRLPYLKVEKLSALKCKRTYGVVYGKGENNKKNMLEYVTRNKDTLIAGDTVKDHNTADSIILLNTWLSLKRRHLYLSIEEYATCMDSTEQFFDVPFELKNTWWECPICKYHTGRMYLCKNPPKDPTRPDMRGMFFMSCRNEKCKAGPSYMGRKPPPIIKDSIGNVQVGIWKRSDGSKKPEEYQSAMVEGCYNTVPVTVLGKREMNEDEFASPEPKRMAVAGNFLEGIVTALQGKQEALEEKIHEMQSKTDETLNKLLLAITGAPIAVPKHEKANIKEKRKEATINRIKKKGKFSAEELEDDKNVQVL